MRAVELFTGAGGLAVALSKAGVEHRALIERDKDCCATIRKNIDLLKTGADEIHVFEGDTRVFNYDQINESVDIVAGGPPCQPFSLGGKHKGYDDQRDMFPEAVRAIRSLKPRAFIFENVKGLTRKVFASYLEYIVLQLTYPELIKRDREAWYDHRDRLEKYHTKGYARQLEYKVMFRVLNAADYGVPQKRERVFFVGFRAGMGAHWTFPEPTHSYDALLKSKWVTGEYWKKHKISPPRSGRPETERLNRYVSNLFIDERKPWMTVRDAISDLPDPLKPNAIPNHEYRGGSKRYQGHTGSVLDEPAKTLKAGVHGVPGGENMVVLPDGTTRYFTNREAARVQTFPDSYIFTGSWTEIMRQIGNAVPVELGKVIVDSVMKALNRDERTSTLQSA
ncbi:MAG TPA: DNA (cytosine-5-)-methyltransferase [Spirochaetia bacterium]|nr:DNA (cytosine-5-)-methyltransferase [Spirochaetia bacterium]